MGTQGQQGQEQAANSAEGEGEAAPAAAEEAEEEEAEEEEAMEDEDVPLIDKETFKAQRTAIPVQVPKLNLSTQNGTKVSVYSARGEAGVGEGREGRVGWGEGKQGGNISPSSK